jgi:hypothetical protein
MLVVERTHRLRDDRAWLPRKVRLSARFTTSTMLAGAGAATVGVVIAAPAALFLWKGMLLGGAGLALASNRAGKAVMQRQLRRMARGEIELADVKAHAEGELVVVRGTVEAEKPLRGILVDATGIYRRLEFAARRTWVHEAAVDFSLIDDAGERILVEAAGARWLVPSREKVTYPAERFTGAQVPPSVRALAAGRTSIEAFEQVLGVGERVQIVGYKSTSADVSGDVIDYRLPPQRATLRSGPELPLVITLLADLA